MAIQGRIRNLGLSITGEVFLAEHGWGRQPPSFTRFALSAVARVRPFPSRSKWPPHMFSER